MKVEHATKKQRNELAKEIKEAEKNKRRELRLLKLKMREERKKNRLSLDSKPSSSSAGNVNAVDGNERGPEFPAVDAEDDADMQGDSWQDMILHPDILNDVMVDSLLEAEIEGQFETRTYDMTALGLDYGYKADRLSSFDHLVGIFRAPFLNSEVYLIFGWS
jgi:hypothetical protein